MKPVDILVNVVDVQKMTPARVVCVQLAMFLVLAASVQLISARYVYTTMRIYLAYQEKCSGKKTMIPLFCKSQIPLRYPGLRRVRRWSQTRPRLVADLQRAVVWPIIQLASSELARASRSATSFGLVCDQDSVMEFGLNRAVLALAVVNRIRKNYKKAALTITKLGIERVQACTG